MPALCRCAQSQHRGLQKESLWALGSVTGSPGPAGVAAVKQADAVPILLTLLKSGAFDVRKEAAFALANVTAGVSADLSGVKALSSCVPRIMRQTCRWMFGWAEYQQRTRNARWDRQRARTRRMQVAAGVKATRTHSARCLAATSRP